MALPCFCIRCAIYKELKTLRDPLCLAVEEKNCQGRDCDNCDFICEGFTDKEGDRSRTLLFFKDA